MNPIVIVVGVMDTVAIVAVEGCCSMVTIVVAVAIGVEGCCSMVTIVVVVAIGVEGCCSMVTIALRVLDCSMVAVAPQLEAMGLQAYSQALTLHSSPNE